MYSTKKFMERVYNLRKEKGLSQRMVAAKIGATQMSICNYESGKNIPNFEILCAIADYYGVSIDWLVGRTDIKNPAPTAIGNGEIRKTITGTLYHNRKEMSMTNTEKVLKIVSLAMEINGENYDDTSDKPCVSCEISPHVNSVWVTINRDWCGYSEREIKYSYYNGFGDGVDFGPSCVPLDKMIAILQALADEVHPPEPRPDIVEV